MSIHDIQKEWDALGQNDPLWAVLTEHDKAGNRWNVADFFQTGVEQVRALMSYLDARGIAVPRQRALDFGCGVGRLSQALCEHFAEVDGIDIAPSMIAHAIRYNRHGDRCRYHLNGEANLRIFPSDQFSFVYSSITLQHIPPHLGQGYVREFGRVLAPWGVMVFQVPGEPVGNRELLARVLRRQLGPGIIPLLKLPTLYRLYYRLRRRPVMEMHCIKRTTVEQLLRECAMRLLDVTRDDSGGNAWIGYQYCAMKPA